MEENVNNNYAKQRKTSLIILVIIIVILLIAVTCMATYILTNSSLDQSKLDQQIQTDIVDNSENIQEKEEEEISTPKQEAVEMPKASDYHISSSLNSEGTSFVTPIYVKHMYMKDYTDGGIETLIMLKLDNNLYIRCSVGSKTIFEKTFDSSAFDKKLSEVKILDFGTGGVQSEVFFLLEDGSIEYIELAEMIIKQDITSKKKIAELKDIIKIEQATSMAVPAGGGGYTGVAMDINGVEYELYKYVTFTQTYSQEIINKY